MPKGEDAAMATPLLYTAELDLADADIEPFLEWYAYRHAPDVYEVGLLTCSCYRALDETDQVCAGLPERAHR